MWFVNLAPYLYFSESSGRRWLVGEISPTLYLFSSWNDANETTNVSRFSQEFRFKRIQEVFKGNYPKGNSIIWENKYIIFFYLENKQEIETAGYQLGRKPSIKWTPARESQLKRWSFK